LRNASGEAYVRCTSDDWVKLYHNDSEKLATTSTGIDVTGSVTCDGFTSTGIDDNATSTAITIDASENVALAGSVSIAGGVGKLSSPSANDLAIYGTESGHNGIRFHDVGLLPTNNAGEIIDNDCDLGISSHRFKDLYLSGSVYLGDTAAANALDDYEEGTWTPGISFSDGVVGITYTTQVGRYTKVGDMVTASCYFKLSSKGTSTGNAAITGLPFTSSSTAGTLTAATTWFKLVSFADHHQGDVSSSATKVGLTEVTNAGSFTNLLDTNFINTSEIMLNVTYRV
jgi:hypothetical protein